MVSSPTTSINYWKIFLQTIKGSSHGIYYGAKTRFTHSLVMAILFKRSGFKDGSVLKMIWRNSKEHGINLASFVALFKISFLLLKAKFPGEESEGLISFFSGILSSAFFWSKKTSINKQICFYLLSRILYGGAKKLG